MAEPHDARRSTRDLHDALRQAGVHGPYLVAGHSYGGLVARAFTDLYPDDVVGMVLVDASHPDQWAPMRGTRGGRTVAAANRIAGYLAWLGVLRVFDLNRAMAAGLPARETAEMKAILAQPRSWSTSTGSLAIWDTRTRPEVNQARARGTRPLVVLSVTDQPVYAAVLTALQDQLPALSSNSLHLTVEGATHESLVAQRDHAVVVAKAIRVVLDAGERRDPLAAQ